MNDCEMNAKQEMSMQSFRRFSGANPHAYRNPRTTKNPLLLCACLAGLPTTEVAAYRMK